MEKIKEFFSSPKRNVYLALLSSVLVLTEVIYKVIFKLYFNFAGYIIQLLMNSYIIGFIIYFAIVVLRMNDKKIDIRLGRNILITTLSISILMELIMQCIYDFDLEYTTIMIVNSIILVYFVNILLNKKNIINNKIFLIIMLLYAIFKIIINNGEVNLFTGEFDTKNFIIYIITLIINISYFGIVPYFYNYYEIIRGEKVNGK